PQLFIPNDGFDVVSVRVEDEGRVSVLFARSRRAVVLGSGVKRCFVKGIDSSRIARVESEVSWRSHLAFGHPEIVAPRCTKPKESPYSRSTAYPSGASACS